MSQDATNHHRKAAEHLEHAARHHRAAAEHHEAANHEKAGHHAHVADGYLHHAPSTEEAGKDPAAEHGG